jgi:hypothetical protein
MKIKKEYTILIAIIIALSLYLILRSPDRTRYQLPKLPGVASFDISKIEISKPDTTIAMNIKDDIWHIAPQGYPANTYKIINLLDIIEKLPLTALVSESKNYTRYDLNDEKKITVRAWAGDTLRREFEVGKATASRKHTFVKLAGDHRVYQAQGNLRPLFDLTVDRLRDKRVLSFERTEIQEIHIAKGQKSVIFSRKQVPIKVSAGQEAGDESPPSPKSKTVWQSADGREADEFRLNSLLTALSNLRCQKYIDGRKKEDFTKPVYKLKMKGAREYSLSIFAKTDKDAKNNPAISSENDYPFILPAWLVKKIMVNPSEIFKEPSKS